MRAVWTCVCDIDIRVSGSGAPTLLDPYRQRMNDGVQQAVKRRRSLRKRRKRKKRNTMRKRRRKMMTDPRRNPAMGASFWMRLVCPRAWKR